MKTLLLKPRNVIEEVEVKNPENLDELYHYLDCDTIEIICLFSPSLDPSDRLAIVIDEKGKFKGKQLNRVATQLSRGYIQQTDFIVGNALIFITHGENLIHLPQDMIDSLKQELSEY